MRQKKIISLICMCAICLTLISGCAKSPQNDSDSGILLYYINENGTALETVSYDMASEIIDDKIEEILSAMREERSGLNKALNDDVYIISYTISGDVLSLNFASTYAGLDTISELFARAALVLTLTQLDEISYVSFYVNDNPVKDSDGETLTMMSEKSFIDNVGKTINNYENTTITLYFANYSGNKLNTEIRKVMYDSTTSLEKYVIEQLIKGPNKEGSYRTIPKGTTIRSIITNNGVCYIDFDENFSSGASSVKDDIMIYSIVNTLTEISYINKVQISVNGNIEVELHNRVSLNQLFARNLSYMED